MKLNGKLVRYIEGENHLPRANWVHIYCMVGDKPFTPNKWYFVEPTMPVPLGWDVVAAGGKLPEMGNFGAAGGTGTGIGIGVGAASVDKTQTQFSGLLFEIGIAVVIGMATAIGTELMLEFVKTTDWYHRRIQTRRDRRMTEKHRPAIRRR